MSSIFFIRHGLCDSVGNFISGRQPGVLLNDKGQHQAGRLALSFDNIGLERIYSSPMQRALQTAYPLSERKNIPVTIADELNELNYGSWTGNHFDVLARDPLWNCFNIQRNNVSIPSGEMIIEVQSRICKLIATVIEKRLSTVAMVSHADPIRVIIGHFLGIPINYTLNLEISPASITLLRIEDSNLTLEYCNKQV